MIARMPSSQCFSHCAEAAVSSRHSALGLRSTAATLARSYHSMQAIFMQLQHAFLSLSQEACDNQTKL